jgi:hypothetical protein
VPVALHVEDELGVVAREPAADEEGRGLVHALDEGGVGPERAQLARDAHRQGEVVERAVGEPRARRAGEPERAAAGRRAGGRGGEHTGLDHGVDGGPLPLERPRERQAYALAGDEEDARTRHRAGGTVSASAVQMLSISSSRRCACTGRERTSSAKRAARSPPPRFGAAAANGSADSVVE